MTSFHVGFSLGGTVTKTTVYYPAGGAMRINGTLCYVLKDHLGSASVVTDASGNVVGDQRYYPFGETRLTTGMLYTDKLFTGQREMAGLGIYHYGARFYSPKLGRFLRERFNSHVASIFSIRRELAIYTILSLDSVVCS